MAQAMWELATFHLKLEGNSPAPTVQAWLLALFCTSCTTLKIFWKDHPSALALTFLGLPHTVIQFFILAFKNALKNARVFFKYTCVSYMHLVAFFMVIFQAIVEVI